MFISISIAKLSRFKAMSPITTHRPKFLSKAVQGIERKVEAGPSATFQRYLSSEYSEFRGGMISQAHGRRRGVWRSACWTAGWRPRRALRAPGRFARANRALFRILYHSVPVETNQLDCSTILPGGGLMPSLWVKHWSITHRMTQASTTWKESPFSACPTCPGLT